MPVESIRSVPTVHADISKPRGTVRDWLTPFWPAAAVGALLVALLVVFVRRSLAANDGHLVYPMDDAYSHMAIARNLYQHGIWGFSSIDGFSSGGSSLIWPLLLAGCFAVFGMHEWTALVLNVIPAIAFFFYAGLLIRRHTPSGWASFFILLAVLYFTPLPTIAFSGMEHCWQILICLGFLDLAVRSLSDDVPPESAARARRWLPLMAFLMTMARYEGLFMLGVVGLLLMYRRQWRTTVLCAVAGGLPIGVFGLYARSKGWHFFPNSLLLKTSVTPTGGLDGLVAFATKGYYAMLNNPHMFILVLGLVGALLVQWRRQTTLWNRSTLLLTILLGGTVLHLQFAGLGWFYRYEGYLLALGILAIGLAVVDEVRAAAEASPSWFERSQRLALLALAVILFFAPMWTRAANAWNELTIASHNIYEQQYQMAHFLRQSYRGKGVAANDIGAIDFFVDIGLVDTWGLGTMEVTQAKLDHAYTQDVVRGLLKKHDVQVIMIYTQWTFEFGGIPAEWVPVGQWTMLDNLICGSPTVWFYAPNATMVPKLVDALQTYSPHLPPGIVESGLYRGLPPPPGLVTSDLYQGQPLPHVQGTYAAERDGGGVFYWTSQAAQFVLSPSNERKDAADVDSTLMLSVRAMSKDLLLDATYNGKVVATRRPEPAEVGKWMDWPIKVHWREGYNFVNVMGHGGKPYFAAGDDRKLLFAIHEPKWTFEDKPEEDHPLPPKH